MKKFYLILFLSILCLMTKAQTYNKIYWGTSSTIKACDLDGSNVETIISEAASYLAIDDVNKKMYYTNYSDIRKADLDGTNVEIILSSLPSATSIELDLVNNKIYWTEFNANKIRRADLDGSNAEDVITGINNPAGMALDISANKIYWGHYNNQKFSRANLDGTSMEDLVTGLSQPWEVNIDYTNSKIYFTDRSKIRRANLDGSSSETLSSNYNPQGVDIDVENNKVYYGGFQGIAQANLDGTGETIIVAQAESGGINTIKLLNIGVTTKIDAVKNSTENMYSYNNGIQVNLPQNKRAVVSVYNLGGNKIKEVVSSSESINIKNLNEGIYIVRVCSNNGISTQKVAVR